MARPESKTVAYFPFIVKDGDTLFLLENKYGCEGLGFFTGVMRFLSQTPDHHYCIKDEVKKMRFFATIKIDEAKGIDMLNIMSITGKINKVLWDGNRVIVSEDFLSSINDAYKKRVNKIITIREIVTFYELMYPEIKLPEPETTTNSKKTDRNPQSILKETILDKTIQYTDIKDTYHDHCKKLPKVSKISDKRKSAINSLLKEFSLEQIIEGIQKAGKSSFINGDNKSNWKASFDWIINKNNMLKIIEGNYDNKGKKCVADINAQNANWEGVPEL